MKKKLPQGSGIGLGIAVGVAIGNSLDNIGAGIAIGIAIGVGIEASLKSKVKPPTPKEIRIQKILLAIGILAVALAIIAYFLG